VGAEGLEIPPRTRVLRPASVLRWRPLSVESW